MSKELEALDRLNMYAECAECDYCSNPDEDYKIVEKALKEHEQYKNIEEQLSINLPTFFEIMEAPEIFVLRDGKIIDIASCDIRWASAKRGYISVILEETHNKDAMCTIYGNYYFKDFGKTWALKYKDLMEN